MKKTLLFTAIAVILTATLILFMDFVLVKPDREERVNLFSVTATCRVADNEKTEIFYNSPSASHTKDKIEKIAKRLRKRDRVPGPLKDGIKKPFPKPLNGI